MILKHRDRDLLRIEWIEPPDGAENGQKKGNK